MNKELYERLEKIALTKTIPFCYLCYKDAPTGRCHSCYSDDLMRHLPGVGVEYGTSWVVKEILSESLNEASFEEQFEQSVDDIYGQEIQVGWLTLNPALVIKSQDPISWEIAKGEHMDSLQEEGQIVTFDGGSTYYWTFEVEGYLSEVEADIDAPGSKKPTLI